MLTIPFNPILSSDKTTRVRLLNQLVSLRLVWNTRSSAWFLTVSKDTGEQLQSLKLVPFYPLMYDHKARKPIPGDFFVFPVNESVQSPITYDGLGSDWLLFWATQDEVYEWEVENGVG